MILRSLVRSIAGVGKACNDDAFLDAPEYGLFAVADGVGASADPFRSSRLAVETLRREFERHSAPLENKDAGRHLKDCVRAANMALYESGQRSRRPMLSTLTAIWFQPQYLCLAHCGDSRAYLCENLVTRLLTHDHTVVGELVERGFLSQADAEGHPQRSMLSACLGQHEQARIDVSQTEIADPTFRLLLCSDGVSGYLSHEDIAATLAQNDPFDTSIADLIAAALERGSPDDLTAILVRGVGAEQ